MRDRLFVALDVESLDDAARLLDRLEDVVTGVKIGSQLFTGAGPAYQAAYQRLRGMRGGVRREIRSSACSLSSGTALPAKGTGPRREARRTSDWWS